MASKTRAGEARRDAALAVLTTGVAGDPLAERVAWGLIALASAKPIALELDADEIVAVRELAAEHRVNSMVARLIGTNDNTVTRLADAMATDRHLLDAIRLLDGAGVPVLVLKGNATARLDHADPSDREVGDIDLLVRPEHLDAALEAFDGACWRRTTTHPFTTAAFFHSETLVHADGAEVDLHHRLAQPSRAPRSCWRSPESFVLGGVTLDALPRDWRFLHALVHQMMNPPPSMRALNGLVDLVRMWTAGIDLEAVRAAGSEIGMPTLTERGLSRLADLLGEASLPSPRRPARAGKAERRLAAALDTDGPTPGYLALAANLAVQPWRHWPKYGRELLWPTRAYREEMGITLRGQILHVAREAIGR